MNQLTKTNNQFKLDETLMEQVFKICGYQFTIVKKDSGETYFIAKEVAKGLGYKSTETLTKPIKRRGLPLLILTKENGLPSLKLVSSISKNTRNLTLIPNDTLQEYIIGYARKPDAKEVGKKLYDYLTHLQYVVEKKVEKVKKPENALQKLLRSEKLKLGSGK